MSVVTPPSGNRDAGSFIAVIWERNRDDAFARLMVLEDAVAALIENRLSEEMRRAAEREAHRLAGSAGTFGFLRASESARQLERIFSGTGPVPVDSVFRAADEAMALRSDLGRDAQTPSQVDGDGTGTSGTSDRDLTGGIRGLIVAVAGERRRNKIAATAAARGFQAILIEDPDQMPTWDETPVAALIDLGFAGATPLIACLGSSTPAIPSLALTPGDVFSSRVEAVRAGAQEFLAAAAQVDEQLDAIERMLSRPSTTDTVLIVDDDPAILNAVDAVLGAAGLRIVGIEDPSRFWKVLEGEQPDLVILDLDMPGIRGDELCRVIRGDARWSGLPILFLTADRDVETAAALFTAGADDFVPKPFHGPELLARVRSRIDRTRLLRAASGTDPLTGLANRRQAEPELQMLLDLADRMDRPVSFAMLDLDHFKRLNDDYGHAVGDLVLRRVGSILRESFRREDVVSRWGGEEFLLGLYAMGREDALQQLSAVLERLRHETFPTPSGEAITVTFSAGVASYPADSRSVDGLWDAAEQALYRAKRDGRGRVLPAGSSGAGQDTDVVIVEDDNALAELLAHALATRGYGFHRLSDGQEAADQLAGSPPLLHGRVVLLDVDLPALNGFGVLRRMASAGQLPGTRVIMLTARSSEREIVEALELGAFDHVSKPFSVPVLMQRIHRALEA